MLTFGVVEKMMIPQERMQRAVDALRRMGARRVLLFGSCLEAPETAGDVDLAVEGVPLDRLLDADVTVQDILQVPVDLVSREDNQAFFELVSKRGRVLFEKS